MNYSEKLRALADYLDDRPALRDKLDGDFDYPAFSVYADSWEDFQDIVKTLGGFEKSGYGGSVTATHTKNLPIHGRVYRVYVYVNGACERVEKVDESGKVVYKRVQEYVETDKFEPVYEWKCPENWLPE